MPGETSSTTFAYLRGTDEVPLAQQRRAMELLSEREAIPITAMFEDASDGRAQLLQLLWTVERTQAPGHAVVVTTMFALGDDVTERALRVLQFGAVGAQMRLLEGVVPDGALLSAWTERGVSERRRELAREGMRRRALRGEVLGRTPYGYAAEDRHLVPDEREAPIVRRMFERYLAGEGVRRIARELNADGVTNRRGKPWTASAIRLLLRNPVYIGTYRRLDVSVSGAHSSLVQRGDFEAVQRRMSRRAPKAVARERHRYLLAGLLRCGYCGGSMVGASHSRAGAEEPYRYYRCGSAVNEGRCAYHSQRTEQLEAAVRAQLLNAQVVETAAPARAASDDDEPRQDRTLLDGLERFARGEWKWDELQRRMRGHVLARLAEEHAANGRDDAPVSLAAARRRLAEEWEALPQEERRRLLEGLVHEIVVTEERIEILAHAAAASSGEAR
jgi:DNA invertase Pin-like site-specific DNA recombinase